MVVSADIFISKAQMFLCCGKKKKRQIPHSSCLDMAVQIIAVDLGLKPAVLYDLNSACAEQIQRYVSSLHEAGVLNTTLRIFSISGSCLVVNCNLMKEHLSEVLEKKSLLTVDVCAWKEQPSLIVMDSSTKHMVKEMLDFIMDKEDQHPSIIVVEEELHERWNLCTLFGILLGYPTSYWFNQAQSFENCLSMTPLVVNKVWVCWPICDTKHSSCLYSFSVPEVLWAEIDTFIQNWVERLRGRFCKQTVLIKLSISKETVILPTVAL
ncbi:hypothetical protein Q7C36_005927 [Tachysurus vachellii]|uniref:Uncharacterized protein n=1 Tax=Tachysurus vachellii TaxID=175792 RepID=A0AA88NIG5_TACVA|nr:UPF0739 protein C1orf74 homolog [Tachysurus vachellii]KAK2858008.1 hypothetical protein Q7C36_005927 [Tachysurus vachellii]